MTPELVHRPSRAAALAFHLLDPIPFGCFAAASIFDIVYAKSGEILWMKSAAWLIAMGLVFAVIPRSINLVQVWFTGQRPRRSGRRLAFWLNFVGIVSAIVNAFVHSRDAYGVMPEGAVLSASTVLLFAIANVVQTLNNPNAEVRS